MLQEHEFTSENAGQQWVKERNEMEDLVTVKEDRIILKRKVKNKYPVICGDKNIELYLNGRRVTGSVILTNETELKFKVKEASQKNSIEIFVTDDKLKAYLKTGQKHEGIYRLMILPAPGEDEDILVGVEKIQDVPSTPATEEEVLQYLAKAQITFGLKKEAVKKAIAAPGRKVLIAEGKPPVKSTNGYIEYLFKEKEKEPENGAQFSDKVDHFSFHKVRSVKKGEILAVKYPPQLGKVGYNVYGEKTTVAAPTDPQWRIGDGVEVVDNQAIAVRSGRPAVKDGYLTVLPVYCVENDLDLSVGNIDFHGDVTVKGNVQDNFRIKATGMVKVGQSMTQALVESDNSVEVENNIIGCRVTAGGNSIYYQEACSYLNRLGMLFAEQEKAVKVLKNNALSKMKEKKHGDRAIIQLLLDTKYRIIVANLKSFYKLAGQFDTGKTVTDLIELFKELPEKISEKGRCNIENLAELNDLRQRIIRTYEIIKKLDVNKAYVQAGYIQNSQIKAGGDIMVTKKGVYNSYLLSGGKVIIKGNPGVFRGGVIQARGDVFVKELGSPGGSKVLVQTDAGNRIIATKVYANVTLTIGDRTYKFEEDDSGICARIDRDGKLALR